jgi:hypothetical protein
VLEAGLGREEGRIDVLVSNAGIQIIKPGIDLPFADWEALVGDPSRLAKSGRHHLHGFSAFERGLGAEGAKHGMLGPCRVVAKEGAACNVRAIVVCPGFVRTPPVDQQIPEQAKELGINEDNVVKHLMLKDTVDGEFTTTRDPRGLRRPRRTRRPGCSRTAQRARPTHAESLHALDWLNFFLAALLMGFGPFVAVKLADRGWVPASIGLVLTASGVASLLTQVPAGELIDISRSKRMLVGMATTAIISGVLIFGLRPDFPSIFAAALIQGTAGSVLGPGVPLSAWG